METSRKQLHSNNAVPMLLNNEGEGSFAELHQDEGDGLFCLLYFNIDMVISHLAKNRFCFV